MQSPWHLRILLPAARALAEGSWLAVAYAALQALAHDVAHVGPLELCALVGGGMAWGRRRRWTSGTGGVVGLPLLMLLAGMLGWLLDQNVRASLLDGNLPAALAAHVPGWLAAALAFWRGAAHRFREDDATIEDPLLRWALPSLAIPWLIGYAAASGPLEAAFAAAAFVSTILFVGSAFGAIGLARLQALRLSSGSDWRGDRTWLVMIVVVTVLLVVLSLPLAALLGIATDSLFRVMVVPVQTLILIMVLVTAPALLLAAVVAGLLKGLLPEDIRLFEGLRLPSLDLSGSRATSDLPGIILTVIVASLFLFDVIVIGAMIWMSYRGRRRREDPSESAFEERAIVVPAAESSEAPPVRAGGRSRHGSEYDATGAYLAALDALAVDGRWPRRAHETPAAHLARARAEGLAGPSFSRLVAAYQIARYSPGQLPSREQKRARSRLVALRAWLRTGRDLDNGIVRP